MTIQCLLASQLNLTLAQLHLVLKRIDDPGKKTFSLFTVATSIFHIQSVA